MKQVEYYDLDIEAIEIFKKKLILTMYKIGKMDKFEATPSAKACRYCDYFEECKEGLASAQTRKRPRKVYIAKENTGSVMSFGFGD